MDITANLQRGEALFLDGLLDEAEIVFQEILCLKPDHYEALNNLGVISHSRGAVEEAEQFFLNAVDVSGEYLEALSNLADLYESRREWGKALVQIRRLLDLKPEDDGLKERLARLRVETSSMEIQPHLDVRRTKIEDKAGDPDSSPSTFLDQGSLKAAFLEVNITPEVSPSKPVYLQGMAGGLRKATSISSPLMMQLLLIEDANFTKLLLVSADLFGFGSEIVSLVRSMAEPWGIQPEGILLNASHTHYAPGTVSTTSSELGPFHEQYSKTIGNAIGQSLDALYERLEACEIGLGHTDLQIGLNRRLPGRDGILFAPNKRGYYDSLTPFFRVELRQTGKKLVVLNHGCHPTGLGNLPLISSDFVGYMRESLKQKGVADGVMFFQGAAGSSKEAAYSENKRSSFSQSLEDARRNGVYMAEKIALALQSQLLPVKGDIFCTMNTASLPINHLPAKEIVEQVSKKHDSPPVMREWVEKLNKAFPEGRYPSSIPMDLQMVCIGKALRLLSFPAEPVSEVAVKLREAAPEGAKTFILGYTNGLLGYLPTDTMIKDGGYEPRESSFYYLLPSPFALGTESAVMKAFASCMEKQQEEGKPNGYGRYHLNRNPRRAFFVLSSGRCGTLTLAKLLSTATNAKVWHHPRPYLVRETLEAYWGKADKIATFWKARASIIQKTWADGLIHGETDHNLTAFSDVIAQEIPDAKFIILVRDPRDFVRSGMRRGYYTGHPWDIGRLRPCEDAPDFEQWKTMEPFDKVCWLWSETYQRIQVLAEKIGRDRVMMLCFEELISKPETVYPLFNFLGLEGFDRQIIAEKQKNRYNQQTSGTFPKVEEWSTQLHSIISNYCGVPALRYGYDLRRSVPANAKNDAIRAPDDGSKVECSEKKAPFVNLHRYGIYVHPASVIKCRHVQIGKGTRINGPITIKGVGSCVIGKYCALGDDIHIITSNHLMGYANLQDGLQSRMGFRNILSHKGIIEIGCNVWIGDNVLLLPGVKVGHGAVIGAGSVVTRGVPDFTVVAGVPASEIRKRFSEEIIAQMLDIAWWDWPEERMLKNHVFFETDFGLKPDLDISAILVE